MPAESLSAGALSVQTLARAAWLVADVARRASGAWDGAADARAAALALGRRALALGTINEQAYRGAVAALDGELELAPAETRDAVLGDMLDRAAEAPLALTTTAADLAVLAVRVGEHAPDQGSADAIAAALIAAGVARATTHLVAVNLVTLEDDPRLHQARGEVARVARALRDGV
jgi:formiminotetrahydrofolate cyclodeaminase